MGEGRFLSRTGAGGAGDVDDVDENKLDDDEDGRNVEGSGEDDGESWWWERDEQLKVPRAVADKPECLQELTPQHFPKNH